jgi:hypothetical protein
MLQLRLLKFSIFQNNTHFDEERDDEDYYTEGQGGGDNTNSILYSEETPSKDTVFMNFLEVSSCSILVVVFSLSRFCCHDQDSSCLVSYLQALLIRDTNMNINDL